MLIITAHLVAESAGTEYRQCQAALPQIARCIKPDTCITCPCTDQLALHAVVPAQGAAELAEHSFYEYQRLVQKEAEPELIIQLPNRGDETDGPEARNPEFESEDAEVHRDIDLVVTVAFAIQQPNCGLHFHGLYACTDNQVGL